MIAKLQSPAPKRGEQTRGKGRKIMKYYINYNTGAGNEWADTLEAAKELADDGAAYTQQPIIIEDEDGKEVTRRPWWGVQYDEDEGDETDPICFGSYGYFGDWQ